MLFNKQWVTEEIKEKIKKYLETNENKNNDHPKPMGHSKTHSKRKVYSKTILPQGMRKISNKQCNLTPKTTRKRTNKTQS